MAEEQTPPAEAAEGAPAEGSPEAELAAAKAKKKKMMLIASIALAVVGILVAVGVVFFMGGKDDAKKGDAKATDVAAVAIYDVPELNVNLLSDDPASQHFLKMKLAIELANPKDTVGVDKLLPHLQDDWIGFLRQMRMSDMQGSANLQRLKEGLLRRANQSLDPVPVKGVYIRELLVQ